MSRNPIDVPPQSSSHPPDPARRLSGLGLSLSGGGAAGGGAMTGFACALDLFLGSHDINDFTSYTGVSAGAIIAAYLAAGISPLEMVKGSFTRHQGDFVPFRRRDLYRPNLEEVPSSLHRIGKVALKTARQLIERDVPGLQSSERNRVLGVLPSALLSNARLEAVIRTNLERKNANCFADLRCRLRVIFYDLVANERIVAGNGPGDLDIIAVSEAVTASATIPGVFTPRRIQYNGRSLLGVDGGTAGVSLDVRNEADLDLLIAYNHMGYDEKSRIDHASALSVVNLSRQLLLNQRNLDEIANYMDADPTRHVWLFQPPPSSFATMMSYREMLAQSRATYAMAKEWLLEHLDYFGTLLEIHGVRIDPDIARVSFDDIIAHGAAVKTLSR